MAYDKVILVLTMVILAVAAFLAEIKNRKTAKENNYSIEKVRCTHFSISPDLKNGTTYDTTYKFSDGTEVLYISNKLVRKGKHKVYIKDGNKEDIHPYKSYIPMVIGCVFIIIVQIYTSFIK